MPRSQIQENLTQFQNRAGQLEQFPPQSHPVQSNGDVVAATGGVHFSGCCNAASLLQQVFDEEEQIFVRTVEACVSNRLAVEPVESRQQNLLFRTVENTLPRQHARVRVVDLDQRLQKIFLGVIKVRRQYGFGVDWRRKSVVLLYQAGFFPRLTRFANMR